ARRGPRADRQRQPERTDPAHQRDDGLPRPRRDGAVPEGDLGRRSERRDVEAARAFAVEDLEVAFVHLAVGGAERRNDFPALGHLVDALQDLDRAFGEQEDADLARCCLTSVDDGETAKSDPDSSLYLEDLVVGPHREAGQLEYE